MGSDKPITDVQAETAPRRRPGRPRMIETGQEAANDQAVSQLHYVLPLDKALQWPCLTYSTREEHE